MLPSSRCDGGQEVRNGWFGWLQHLDEAAPAAASQPIQADLRMAVPWPGTSVSTTSTWNLSAFLMSLVQLEDKLRWWISDTLISLKPSFLLLLYKTFHISSSVSVSCSHSAGLCNPNILLPLSEKKYLFFVSMRVCVCELGGWQAWRQSGGGGVGCSRVAPVEGFYLRVCVFQQCVLPRLSEIAWLLQPACVLSGSGCCSCFMAGWCNPRCMCACVCTFVCVCVWLRHRGGCHWMKLSLDVCLAGWVVARQRQCVCFIFRENGCWWI